jgi:hypothetical protein
MPFHGYCLEDAVRGKDKRMVKFHRTRHRLSPAPFAAIARSRDREALPTSMQENGAKIARRVEGIVGIHMQPRSVPMTWPMYRANIFRAPARSGLPLFSSSAASAGTVFMT